MSCFTVYFGAGVAVVVIGKVEVSDGVDVNGSVAVGTALVVIGKVEVTGVASSVGVMIDDGPAIGVGVAAARNLSRVCVTKGSTLKPAT